MLGRENRRLVVCRNLKTSNKSRRHRAKIAVSGAAVLACGASVRAATIYWNGTGTTWNSTTDWSTSSTATTPNPAAVPGSGDVASFNITGVTSNQNLTLDANQFALGLVFQNNSGGTVTIGSGTGTNVLTLGGSGITVNANSAGGTISAGLTVTGVEKWANNTNAVGNTSFNVSGPITRTTGSLVDFVTPGLGSAGAYANQGNFVTSLANASFSGDTASTIGGWAVYQINGANDGAWAVANGSGGVTALASASYVTVSSSATFNTSGGTNINVTGNGTVTTPLTVNSIHFSGGNTLTTNSNSSTSGLVIATGGVIIGNVGGNANSFSGNGPITSGNGQDLIFTVFSNAGSGINMNQVITDNGSTPIGLTINNVAGNLKMVLNAANTFTGDTNINGTTGNDSVTITNPLALQFSTINYNAGGGAGGTLFFGSTAVPVTTATLGGLKGSQSLALANNSNGAVNVAVSVGNNNQSTTYTGNINASAGSAITKIGSATWTLGGTNAQWLAPTNVNVGTLKLTGTGSLSNSSVITVAPSAFFDVAALTAGAYTVGAAQTIAGTGTINGSLVFPSGSQITPGGNANSSLGTVTSVGTLTVGNLNFAGGSIINSYFGSPGVGSPGTSSQISTGNLTLPASGLKINLFDNGSNNSNGAIGAGVYDILNYTGTLSGFVAGGSGAGTFLVINTPLAGRTYTFSNTGSQIDLTIGAGSATLGWTGINSGAWDTSTTNNWQNGGGSAVYADPNSVVFGDVGGNTNITVKAGGVTPATVTFTNNSSNYTFNNAGGDLVGVNGSTGITMNGSAGVTFSGPNSFTGPVLINAGTLTIGNGNALGNIGPLSGVTVANGASLRLQGNITTNAQPLSLNGTGVSSTGALNNLTGSNTYAGPMTLAGAATITSTAGSLNITGGITTAGKALTINGAGNVSINTAPISGAGSVAYSGSGTLFLSGTHTYTGGTTIASGTLNVASDSALGSAPATAATNITFSSNATLQAGASSVSLGSTRGISIGSGVTATFDSNGNNLTVGGAISGAGAGGIVKVGAGTVTLANASTYGGVTTVSGGTLALSQAAPLAPVAGAVVQIDATTLSAGYTSVANLGSGAGSFTNFSSAGGGSASTLPALSSTTANQINGHQALVLNGANTALGSSNAYTNTGNQITIFIVEKSNNVGGFAGENSFVGPGGTVDYNSPGTIAVEDNGGTSLRPIVEFNSNPAESTGRPAATPVVWDSTVNIGASTSATSRLTVNTGGNANTSSVSGTVAGTTAFNINTMSLGARIVGGTLANPALGSFWSGSIGEELVYNTALSPTDRAAVEAYLNNKWLGINSGGSLPSTTTLAITGGSSFDINGNTQQIAGLTNYGGTGGTVTNSDTGVAATLVVSQSGSSTFGGAIQNGTGIVGLTISGGGTQTLTGSNTYTGATNISSGKLVVNAGGSLGLTPITVGSTSIFAPQPGTGSITAGSLSLINGSTFDMTDNSIGAFNLSGSGLLLKIGTGVGAAATINLDLSSGGADRIVDAGSAAVLGTSTINITTLGSSLTNGTYPLISATGGLNGNFQFSNGLMTESVTLGSTVYNLALSNSATSESLIVQVPGKTATWVGGSSTSWTLAGNWNPTVVPGATSGSSNIDTVVFNSTPMFMPVVPSGENVQNITFDAGSGAIVMTGSTLTLSANGLTQVNSAVNNDETISVPVVLGGNYTFLSNSGSNNALILNGSVSGGAASGAMVMTLSGSSTGLNVINGQVSNGAATSLGILKSGPGTWALAQSNTYTGDTNINQGVLNIVNGALGSSGNVIFNGGTLQYASGANQDLSARINGSTDVISIDTNGNNVTFASPLASTNTNGLTKLGAGTLTLSAANAYVGPTNISGGALNVATTGALSSTPSVTVASGASLQLSGGAIIGSIPLTMSGTGPGSNGALESLSGSNSYAGKITLTADSTIQSDAGSLTVSGGINGTNVNLTIAGNGNGILSGPITTGNGQLTQNSPGTWALTGSNTFTGGATLNAGVTQANSAASLGDASGNATINAATLEVTSTFSSTRNITLGSSTSTIQVDTGKVYTLRGSVSGSTLNKTGSGTLVLNNSNSYGGGTIITSGTVQAGASSSLGGGDVTLSASGTTLRILPGPVYQAEGFGGSSNNGWTLKSAGQGSAASVSNANVLTLTNTDAANQNRAAWQNSAVNYTTGFSASFVYQGGNAANGAAFVLQNSTAGTNALGGIGGALGYTSGGQNGTPPNNNSIALGWNVGGTSTIEGGQADPTAAVTTASFDAAVGTGAVAINSGDPILFTVTGIGSSNLLNYTLVDETNNNTASGSVALTNTLTNILGGSSALVGFTASTTGGKQLQTISNFSLTNAFTGVLGLGNNVNALANSTLDVSYTGGVTVGNLNVSGHTLSLTNSAGGGTAFLTASGLTNTGTLDITKIAVDIQNGNIGAINAQVAAAYSNGTWTGSNGASGTITSTSAAGDPLHLTAVGVATNLSTFEGQSVNPTDVLIKYTYYGDATLDGQVNSADYAMIDNGFLTQATGWQNGDFNYDGVINGSDYTLIDNAFNMQGAQILSQIATPTAQVAGGSSAVPEPTTLGLLGLGAMGLLSRRRRRSL